MLYFFVTAAAAATAVVVAIVVVLVVASRGRRFVLMLLCEAVMAVVHGSHGGHVCAVVMHVRGEEAVIETIKLCLLG